MKALTLLQFCNLDASNDDIESYPEKQEYMSKLLDEDVSYCSELTLIFRYKDYVNQPFTPEMVEKKFKMTLVSQTPDKDIEGYFDWHWKNDKNQRIAYWESNPSWMSIYDDDFKIPETKDDFIRNCQQACLELEYKEA